MLKFAALLILVPAAAQAAAIFSPGNTIFGVRNDGTNILVAAQGGGSSDVDYTDNQFPSGEDPFHAIDGVGQKDPNFAELNTGIMVSTGGAATIVDSLQLWTANDAFARDPASYQVWGTNAALIGGMPLSSFSLISSGPLALPGASDTDSRNEGGLTALNPAFSQTVTFSNSTAYLNYLILFPTVKDEPAANSMQIAEVQLFGSVVPEPASVLLAGLGFVSVVLRRRRR